MAYYEIKWSTNDNQGQYWTRTSRIPQSIPSRVNAYYTSNLKEVIYTCNKDEIKFNIYPCFNILQGEVSSEICFYGFYLGIDGVCDIITLKNMWHLYPIASNGKNFPSRAAITDDDYSRMCKKIMKDYFSAKYYHVIDPEWAANRLIQYNAPMSGFRNPDGTYTESQFYIYVNTNSTNFGWASGWSITAQESNYSNSINGVKTVSIDSSVMQPRIAANLIANMASALGDITEIFISTSAYTNRTFYLKTTFNKDTSQEGNVVNYVTILKRTAIAAQVLFVFYIFLYISII